MNRKERRLLQFGGFSDRRWLYQPRNKRILLSLDRDIDQGEQEEWEKGNRTTAEHILLWEFSPETTYLQVLGNPNQLTILSHDEQYQ